MKLLTPAVVLMQHFPLRLTIGSGGLSQPGWIESDSRTPLPDRSPLVRVMQRTILQLDVTNVTDWETYFFPKTIRAIVCEHVFEHLDDSALCRSLTLCRRFLCRNGRLRIAVPDGNRPDNKYLNAVRPPADGHQQLFTIDSISALLQDVGFRVEPLEYYDRNHKFHRCPWNVSEGLVYRSYGRDTQQEFQFRDHCYTSIIVDARPTK